MQKAHGEGLKGVQQVGRAKVYQWLPCSHAQRATKAVVSGVLQRCAPEPYRLHERLKRKKACLYNRLQRRKGSQVQAYPTGN